MSGPAQTNFQGVTETFPLNHPEAPAHSIFAIFVSCVASSWRGGSNRVLMRRFRVLQAIVLIAFAVGAIIFLIVARRAQSVAYPDGLRLQWIGVSVGTNTLEYGNPLQKFLDRAKLIPPRGLSFAGVTVRRPQILWPLDQDADLTGWISVRQTGGFPFTSGYYWEGSHLVAANRSGRALENPPLRPYAWSSNEFIVCVPLKAFPRDEKFVRVRIQPPPDGRPFKGVERKWAEFEFENPLQRTGEHWKAAALPVTNELPGLSIALLSISIVPPDTQVHFSISPADTWQVVEGRITDEEGNSFSHYTTRWERKDAWMGFQYSLESNRVWKIETKLVQARHFPFSVDETVPRNELMEVSVKADGPEMPMVDSFGTTYLASIEQNEVSVRRETGPDRPYLMLAEAIQDGQQLKLDGASGSYWQGGRHQQMKRRWRFQGNLTNVVLRFWSPKVVTTEFLAKPDQAIGGGSKM